MRHSRLFIAMLSSAAATLAQAAPAAGYEVWLSDQTNSQGVSAANATGTHGGFVRIWDGAQLDRSPASSLPLVLDVSTDLFPQALATTGSHVSRIHGILPSPDHRHMALNFVASGHLGIVDGAHKRAVCLFRTTGTTTGRQNHMSFWTPDGSAIVVGNQNGRLLERVNVVRSASGEVQAFVFDASASLDLQGGMGRITAQPVAVDTDPADAIRCEVRGTVASDQPDRTPTGAFKQAPGIRPLNTAICPVPAGNSRHVFTSLGGGGMFVVDLRATPMAIVAEYDQSVIRPAGCGGVEAAGFMHLNTGTSASDVSEFTLYRFALDYPAAPAFKLPNLPAPVAVWEDVDNGKLGGVQLPKDGHRDAHGIMLTRELHSATPRYIHQMDRVRSDVEVFKVAPSWHDLAQRHEGRYSLKTSGACGGTVGTTRVNDPTPDLGDFHTGPGTPARIFVALRGPFPLTVSHAAQGSCPGLGIVTLSPDHKSGALTHVLPTTFLDFAGTRNLSDPHAAIVRRK